MQNRPTRAYTTKHGNHTVLLYTYLNADEMEGLQAILAEGVTPEMRGDKKAMEKLPPALILRFSKEMVRTLLHSFDGVEGADGFAAMRSQPNDVFAEIRDETETLWGKESLR